MAVKTLAAARAAASAPPLSQYLVRCPSCGKPAAVHVAWPEGARSGNPVLVRTVCLDGCAPAAETVLALVRAADALTA